MNQEQQREQIVAKQVQARGVRDPLVLAATRAVRRELFVPKDLREEAYEDTPLPIGAGQTISQPYIVAFMIEALALRGGEKVLEIGAASGYAAAVLSEIAREVFTIERIGRAGEDEFDREDIADVRFVQLIGKEGWESEADDWQTKPPRVVQARPCVSLSIPGLIAKHGEVFEKLDTADLEPLLQRIGDARVVLVGDASDGTSEFYRMRARITQRLIEAKGFTIVAAEADWPDAARIDTYVRHRDVPPSEWTAFARFPTWMWRNEETCAFVDWLHGHNASLGDSRRAAWNLRDFHMFETLKISLHTMDRAQKRWSGRTTRTSAVRRRPRWAAVLNTASVSSAARISVGPATPLALEPTTGPWRLQPDGMSRCRSWACGRRTRKVTSGSFT